MVKSLLIASVSLVVGVAAGWFLHARLSDPREEIRTTMQRSFAASCHASVVSLAALSGIEHGDISDVKHKLARQIASYEHTFGDYDGALPDCPTLHPLIMSIAEESPILREELAKKEGW